MHGDARMQAHATPKLRVTRGHTSSHEVTRARTRFGEATVRSDAHASFGRWSVRCLRDVQRAWRYVAGVPSALHESPCYACRTS